MRIDKRYYSDERFMIRLAIALGIIAGLLTFLLAKNLGSSSDQVAPTEVWEFIDKVASEQGLDPEFVYALAWAESSLNAKARSSVARGMMQLTKPAWNEVSELSYRKAWDWRTNVRVAVDYLVFCQEFLEEHGAFNYPLLSACYRFGPYYVKKNGFQISQLQQPKNEIYKRLFSGNIRPVAPPR